MSTECYRIDRAWGDLWLPFVMDVIPAKHLLKVSSEEKDRQCVSDLDSRLFDKIVEVHNITIAVRMRRPHHYDIANRKNEITIRCRRETGAKTEWTKIVDDGWGDLLFYGFANPAWELVPCIRQWTLISLRAIRRIVRSNRCPILNEIPNGDYPRTWFYALKIQQWASLDHKFLVDCNWGFLR